MALSFIKNIHLPGRVGFVPTQYLQVDHGVGAEKISYMNESLRAILASPEGSEAAELDEGNISQHYIDCTTSVQSLSQECGSPKLWRNFGQAALVFWQLLTKLATGETDNWLILGECNLFPYSGGVIVAKQKDGRWELFQLSEQEEGKSEFRGGTLVFTNV